MMGFTWFKFDSNELYVIATTAICSFLAMTLFVNSFVDIESRFVRWFSTVTSRPRWFTVWIFLMLLWVTVRHLLMQNGILTADGDLVVITILWSGVPFMVENVLKSTSAAQMAAVLTIAETIAAEVAKSAKRDTDLHELVISVKEELDRSGARDSTLDALLRKLLTAIEDPERG